MIYVLLILLNVDRYDMVCHLMTAADGAEEFYTNDNNSGTYIYL